MTNNNDMFSPLNGGNQQSKVKPKKDEGVAIPIPDDAPNPQPHPALGVPKAAWVYNTKDGVPILFTCRFVDENRKKQDRPLTYRQYKNGQCRWVWKSVDTPRLLYNLDQIHKHQDKPILVCEGEKAAEAAGELLSEYVAITSPNGSGSPHCADWSVCKGLIVYIWPDNDEAGQEYAEKVAELVLEAGGKAVYIVQIPKDKLPEEWDLADPMPEDWTKETVHELIKSAKYILSPYEEIMQRAQALTPEYSPEEIEELLSDVVALSQAQQGKVKHAISKAAKLSLRDQNAILKEIKSVQHGDEKKPDHWDYAEMVIKELGKQNLLATAAHVWVWRGNGYWETLPDIDLKQKIQKTFLSSSVRITQGLVDAVFSVMKNEIFAEAHEWDLNPDIINVLNGELHFEEGQWVLKPHERKNYRTTIIPHSYLKDAQCPRFLQFLDEVFEGDLDVQLKKRVLLELIGYTLTNTARFEKFVLLIGSGANGKSVVLDCIAALVGKRNVSAVQPAELGNNFKRAHLHEKLANIITEVEQNGTISDGALKAITSGEQITADHKHKPPFDFNPYCTCWFGTNHLPRTKDFSDALYRRAIMLSFNNKWSDQNNIGANEKKADPNLKDKLHKELPGIMRMALEAYAHVLLQKSFSEPQSSIHMKQAWRTNEDQVALFVEEQCIRENCNKTPTGEVFEAYQSWAFSQGVKNTLPHNQLTSRLEVLGFKAGKTTNGKRVIKGLILK